MNNATKASAAVATGTVNPILKKDPHRPQEAASSSAGAAPPSPSTAAGRGNRAGTPGREKKHLTWDEHAIEEHDLLRGTRMKIDEPDTPYTHYDHHSDEGSDTSGLHPRSPDENGGGNGQPSLAAQWGDVSSKLQAVADRREACPLSPAPSRDSNCSDGEDEARKREKEKRFKDARKKHYNEAEMMRRWREQHANDADDDDDDDDAMEE